MHQRVAGRIYVTFSIVDFCWERKNSNLVKIGHFRWRTPCVFIVAGDNKSPYKRSLRL